MKKMRRRLRPSLQQLKRLRGEIIKKAEEGAKKIGVDAIASSKIRSRTSDDFGTPEKELEGQDQMIRLL